MKMDASAKEILKRIESNSTASEQKAKQNFSNLLEVLHNLGKLTKGDIENINAAQSMVLEEVSMIAFELGKKDADGLVPIETLEIYECTGKRGATARGYFPVKGSKSFKVLKGSMTSDSMSNPFIEDEKGYSKLSKELEHKGIISNHRFTIDYVFSSSSAAASVILGHSASGPEQWKKIVYT